MKEIYIKSNYQIIINMYSNLYRPKNIDELSFNNNLSNKLKHIGLHNYIIHGCAGSGKLTRVYCQLADIFGKTSVTKTLTFSSPFKPLSTPSKPNISPNGRIVSATISPASVA